MGPVGIYTGGGAGGETGLLGGGRVPKDHPRVDAYGAVDELNAVLGLVRAAGLPPVLDSLAGRLQEELFVLGADLAAPEGGSVRLPPEASRALEAEIDALERDLDPLASFILPGGCPSGAQLHLARTVCRRAERSLVALVREGAVRNEILVYVNRLSDLLFVMARHANAAAGRREQEWKSR